MSMNAIPKFDLSGMTLKDDAAFGEALKTTSTLGDRFFKPGKHEVTVLSSEYLGVSADPTWGKVKVEYEGVGGKTIRDVLLVPFKDIMTYADKNGKNTTAPAKRLKSFLDALGTPITIANLGSTLSTYFAKDNSLCGLNVGIECAFKKNYVDYRGKDAAGANQLVLVSPDGVQVPGTPVFTAHTDVQTYAEKNNIPYTKYVDIVRYVASATPNAKPATNW